MLTNTLNIELGFTKTSRSLALVEREARELAAATGQRVAIYKDAVREGFEYTGFTMDGSVLEDQAIQGEGSVLVGIVGNEN